MLHFLKKTGKTVSFKRPSISGEYALSILVFADASRKLDHGQLGTSSDFLFGDIAEGSTFHALSWTSRKSKRPVKSVASAEILAAGEPVDEGKLLRKAFDNLLGIDVELVIALDSKDLFDTLSTCRGATDRLIRADVNIIHFEFVTRVISRIIWKPGKTNMADRLTKHNSPLAQPPQLMLFAGIIPFPPSFSLL